VSMRELLAELSRRNSSQNFLILGEEKKVGPKSRIRCYSNCGQAYLLCRLSIKVSRTKNVVSLAACVEGWQRGTRSVNSNESLYESFEEDTMSNEGPSRWLRPRERDILLNKEMAEDSQGVDCCPSVAETIEPQGGRNEQGLLVELYSDHNTKQR
ncbi:unnamed protein product, partial [Nesidiocoris tenuis]